MSAEPTQNPTPAVDLFGNEEDQMRAAGLEDWQRMRIHFATPEDRATFAVVIGQHITEGTPAVWFPEPSLDERRPPFLTTGGWVRSLTNDQPDLPDFDRDFDWQKYWRGMPAYVSQDMRPLDTVDVYFVTMADRQAFRAQTKLEFSDEISWAWFPYRPRRQTSEMWVSTDPSKCNPRYPVYIPTKGRWDTAKTIRWLEHMGVPYYAVVQPQEADAYKAVVKTGQLLVLPPERCVPGLGVVPARNWIRDHAVAMGARRHWQMDDNINGFYRLSDNQKITMGDGTMFRVMEDFSDRYTNVAVAGPHYDFFAPASSQLPPLCINTRVYSCSLINNEMPHMWRDVYNEDTDICLRALKDGLCTVQFYAFLQKKSATMQVKGGNTDLLYAADGRRKMAESLKRQHPDCVTIIERWGRVQHLVDYRRFRKNELLLRPDVVLKEGVDEYDMTLVAKRSIQQRHVAALRLREARSKRRRVARVFAAGPSVWDFLDQSAAEAPAPPLPVVMPSIVITPADDARALLTVLAQRGHKVFRHEGNLRVTEASRLTEDDRAAIKRLKPALLDIAEPWHDVVAQETPAVNYNDAAGPPIRPIDPVQNSQQPPAGAVGQTATTPVATVSSTQTLAQYLRTAPSEEDSWRPDEPPSLDGVDEIVLNFATDGLDWRHGARPGGVTVSSLDGQLVRFLPWRFQGGNLDEAAVKRWMQTEVRGKRIVGAHASIDVHFADAWGVDLEAQGNTVSDVMHYAALLDDHRRRFALDILIKDYLGDDVVDRVDETQHLNYHAAAAAARERYTVQATARLRNVMWPQLDAQDLQRVRQVEDDVIFPVCEMERNGSPINMPLLEQFSRECIAAHDRLVREISAEVGFSFDHTAKGWQRLFERLGIPPSDEGYAEDVINAVPHPLVQKGHRAAQFASLNSKVFAAYAKQIGSDGVLYYDINQLRGDEGGTVSGRFSIGYVQQVPKHDNHHAVFGEGDEESCRGLCALFPRRLFVAGTYDEPVDYLEADAMQIEQRLFANDANNASVIAEYEKDPTRSFHKITWEMLKQARPSQLYSETKNFNFAFQYGAKSIKLATMMGFITAKEGEEIRRAKRWDDPRLKQIKEIEAAYKRMLPEGSALLDLMSHLAKPKCDEYCKSYDALHKQYPHQGYVTTLLGRRSRFDKSYKTYIGLNRRLQGTGADIMKRKLYELHRERKHTGLVLRLTVHDAVGGDALLKETPARVAEILNRQSYPELRVPILWDVKTGPCWAECH